MADVGIKTEGLGQVVTALSKLEPLVAAGLKAEMKKAGDSVRAEAQTRFEGYDPKSAAGYRVYLRGGGSRVDVEQSIGRTTGRHPEWGTLQMRTALLPALADKQDELVGTVEEMITALGERI